MAEATVSALASAVGATVIGEGELVVTAVTHDSSRVTSGAMFCCIRGEQVDGHSFAREAVAAGAVALLIDEAAAEDGTLQRDLGPAVTLVVVPDTRRAMGPLAARFWSYPSQDLSVIGVTGTNGKTTTVTLVAQLLERLGVRCGVIGTLTGVRTTPEAPDLQEQLRAFADTGHAVVAMEVSSHALALHRVDGTRFAAAVFTNLGLDHLDFHGTEARYFEAKARLFDPELSEVGIVNLDDVHGRLLRDASDAHVIGYSLDDLDGLELGAFGARFTWRGHAVALGLCGRFNVSNALAAAEVLVALGHDPAEVARALATVSPPPGRFEMVSAGQPFAVVVDYAHTPDALENLLVTADELVAGGSLRLVFGCGGDRDRSKRPLMGAVASEFADFVMITSDNPRSEDPAAIIAAVKSGCGTGGRARSLAAVVDRHDAIRQVLADAVPGDVVVIAGKGHETTQVSATSVVEFDDRVVAAEVLGEQGWVVSA